jgi:hypothetical protein
MVSTVLPSGEVKRAPPGAFGALTNAHHIKVGGPWDTTFEPVFNAADAEMGELISWLLSLETRVVVESSKRFDRILAQPLPLERQSQLARTTASLIARSPRTRDEIQRRTRYYREQFRLAEPEPEDHLVATNQRGLYDAYLRLMTFSGRWAVLFSDTNEFIFGDGFVHDFPASADGLHATKRAIVPLTPTIALVYALPTRYPTEPRLVTMRVAPAEVRFLNDALQGYANNFLFYRSQQPELIRAFTEGGHRQFAYHRHEWLEELLDDVSQYNLWGPGGTPSRCEGQFLKSFRESERFEALLSQRREEDSKATAANS